MKKKLLDIFSRRGIYVYAIGCMFVSLVCVPSYADNVAAVDLTAERVRLMDPNLRNLPEAQECKIRWDALWKLAKMGDIDAISALFFYNFPTSAHSPTIYMPGPEDQLSRRRNLITLAVYSAAVGSQKKDYSERYKELSRLAYEAYLNDGREGSEFLKCLNKKEQLECVNQIKGKLVPSFGEFIAEIEALTVKGASPECHLRSNY